MTAATIQPHSKKRIKPTDLYKPIDKQKAKPKHEQPKLSAEERRKRFEEMVSKMGPEVCPPTV